MRRLLCALFVVLLALLPLTVGSAAASDSLSSALIDALAADASTTDLDTFSCDYKQGVYEILWVNEETSALMNASDDVPDNAAWSAACDRALVYQQLVRGYLDAQGGEDAGARLILGHPSAAHRMWKACRRMWPRNRRSSRCGSPEAASGIIPQANAAT